MQADLKKQMDIVASEYARNTQIRDEAVLASALNPQNHDSEWVLQYLRKDGKPATIPLEGARPRERDLRFDQLSAGHDIRARALPSATKDLKGRPKGEVQMFSMTNRGEAKKENARPLKKDEE